MSTYSVQNINIDNEIVFSPGKTAGTVLTVNSNGTTYWGAGAGGGGGTGTSGTSGWSFNWQGDFDGGTTYSVNDVVFYQGSSYICTSFSFGNYPTDTAYFSLLSKAGTNGTSGTGTSGTSGLAGVNGTSGTSGRAGTSGTSGLTGVNGTSGTSGLTGTAGTSGVLGATGPAGTSGTSGSGGSTEKLYKQLYTATTTAIPSGSAVAGRMVGLGSTFSSPSGVVSVGIHLTNIVTQASTTFNVFLRYGTGTSPSNGDNLTGTIAATMSWRTPGAAFNSAVSIGAVIGLSPSTTYWFDISLSASSATTTQAVNINTTLIEI
jgi:hypothetical protein